MVVIRLWWIASCFQVLEEPTINKSPLAILNTTRPTSLHSSANRSHLLALSNVPSRQAHRACTFNNAKTSSISVRNGPPTSQTQAYELLCLKAPNPPLISIRNQRPTRQAHPPNTIIYFHTNIPNPNAKARATGAVATKFARFRAIRSLIGNVHPAECVDVPTAIRRTRHSSVTCFDVISVIWQMVTVGTHSIEWMLEMNWVRTSSWTTIVSWRSLQTSMWGVMWECPRRANCTFNQMYEWHLCLITRNIALLQKTTRSP